MRAFARFVLVVVLCFLLHLSLSSEGPSSHSNNWAVLVCTSRFWFNYRHIANTMTFYHIVKQMGIPDSNIILMLADDVACNPRNSFPAQIFNNANQVLNLYGERVEVDYRGYEVTVESFIRVLTDRHDTNVVPASKRLRTDENSNILIYMTGHGGNEFLKFQDAEEISAMDIADAIQQMHLKKRYKEILLMIDTCQAGTLFNRIYSPNVVAVGSSRYAENSYSHHSNFDVGVAIIDRFTFFTLEFFERQKLYRGHNDDYEFNVKRAKENYNDSERKKITLGRLFKYYDPEKVLSHPVVRAEYMQRSVENIPITDFFGQDIPIQLIRSKDIVRVGKMIDTSGESIPSLNVEESIRSFSRSEKISQYWSDRILFTLVILLGGLAFYYVSFPQKI